jgi:hypothetical protein
VKRTLFAVALATTLTLSAAAEQAKKPATSVHHAGNPAASNELKDAVSPTPPTLCKPCAFYGGDLDPSDPNAAGLSDENTFYVPGSSTYTAVDIPTGSSVVVQGLLVNVQASAAFDPQTASYDIRTGISEGNGGTSLASGTANAKVVATGRTFNGAYEYTIAVDVPKILLTSGEYWFNVTPTCMNTLDGSCYVFRQFESNTTAGGANNVRGLLQPAHAEYLNSALYGADFNNWCDSQFGLNSIQCSRASFGVIGVIQ